MVYLLTKIFVLMFLAALLGGWLAWWWFKRRYADVTVEHSSLRDEWRQWRQAVDRSLAELAQAQAKPADLSVILNRLDSLQDQLTKDQVANEVPLPKSSK
jgi:hypothetical protein